MRSNMLMIVMTLVMFVGCSDAKGGGTTTPSNIKNKTITPEDKKPKNTAGAYENYKPVEINLDDLSFEEAFKIEYRAKGDGHTFWWKGDEYTTDLAIMLPDNQWYESSRWVRNSDDLDDGCYSNEFDACGECDGPGMITWYKDWDDDGLGDPTIYIKACTYPSVDEE